MMFPKPTKRSKSRVKTMKASLHLMAVKLLPCAICGAAGPSDAHHPRSDSYGGTRASDYAVIPLCKRHHMVGPEAYHANKRAWEELNGPDWHYISQTLEAIGINTDTDWK